MKEKLKVAVIYGGKSTEHDVSIVSAKNVIENLDKEKYEVFQIYIDKDGVWYKVEDSLEKRQILSDEINLLKKMDVVFPVLHGLYGEDGTIQGMLEMAGVKYVGCKVLSSSICMDKAYAKMIFEKAKINQAPYIYIKKQKDKIYYIDEDLNQTLIDDGKLLEIVKDKLKYPLFIKPSNSGSSVGINKAHNEEELIKAVEIASKYDQKILIEQGIKGKEVECAVLGINEAKASTVGEILPAEEFYTYDAKYNDENSKTLIPANLSEEKIEEIRKIAVKAFKAVDGSGLSRVDFFVEENTQKVYINEINTMPGFTNISMYPKLWEYCKISYSKLLDELISLA